MWKVFLPLTFRLIAKINSNSLKIFTSITFYILLLVCSPTNYIGKSEAQPTLPIATYILYTIQIVLAGKIQILIHPGVPIALGQCLSQRRCSK